MVEATQLWPRGVAVGGGDKYYRHENVQCKLPLSHAIRTILLINSICVVIAVQNGSDDKQEGLPMWCIVALAILTMPHSPCFHPVFKTSCLGGPFNSGMNLPGCLPGQMHG